MVCTGFGYRSQSHFSNEVTGARRRVKYTQRIADAAAERPVGARARLDAALAEVTSDGAARAPAAAPPLTLRRSHAHLCDLVDGCTPCGAAAPPVPPQGPDKRGPLM